MTIYLLNLACEYTSISHLFSKTLETIEFNKSSCS